MKDVYAALKKCAAAGAPSVLISVAEKSGSAPRGVGAALLLLENGGFAGSIGGGELEYIALGEGAALFETKRDMTKKYALGVGGGRDTGMACGGEVTLSFRFVLPGDREAILWCAARAQERRALIFGAGHVAAALCPVLTSVGFECHIFDDRAALLTAERFPGAEELCLCRLEDMELSAGPEDYILIMTHGHAHDMALLSRAMRTGARYIGVIGSKKKAAMARERLISGGALPEELSRLHCPVGLDIGGETPAEIAISIAAQMIAIRAGKGEI